MTRPIRFLLSRDEAVDSETDWALARRLRDAGFEVVLGGVQDPEQIAETARDEGVDLVGFEVSGDPAVVARLVAHMGERGIGNLPVVVAASVEESAAIALRELGVREIFQPSKVTEETLERLRTVGRSARF